MTKHRLIGRKAVTAVGITILAAVIVLLLFTPQLLLLRDADTGRIYLIRPCPAGCEFTVEFTHSVNLSPVIDFFIAEDGIIRATKAKFYAFGAGMPTELNPGEAFAFTEDGAMEITGITRTYDKLSYIVGTVYDYYLALDGETYNLTQVCGRNTHVEVLLISGLAGDIIPWHKP